MKASDTKAVVMLDTNAYRRMGRGRSDAEAERKGSGLAALDSERQIQALLHPFVILELTAHLAVVDDPEWDDCRAALLVAWHHCSTTADDGTKLLATPNDPEAALCRLVYQEDPPGHSDVCERLARLCRLIATHEPDAAKTDGNAELTWWANHLSDIEKDFVADMMEHVIRDHIPNATSWDALKTDPAKQAEALETIDSADFVNEVAAANVRKAARLLKKADVDPDFEKRVELVGSAFRASFELYRAVLRRVIVDGVDVSKTKYRNWIWDLYIAFSIGEFTVFDQRPVHFVTDDKMILSAADAANLGDFVRSFDQYSADLRAQPSKL